MIYKDVFSCIPNDFIHNRASLRQCSTLWREKIGHTTIDLGIAPNKLESYQEGDVTNTVPMERLDFEGPSSCDYDINRPKTSVNVDNVDQHQVAMQSNLKNMSCGDIPENTKCKLLHWCGDEVVAEGRIASTDPKVKVHHVPLGGSCWNVGLIEFL